MTDAIPERSAEYIDTHPITAEERAEVEARMSELAEAEAFEVRRLAVDDDDVLAEWCRPSP